MRRVVITGLGTVAPNGIGKEAFWAACIQGISAAAHITAFDVSQMTSQIACEVKNFDPRDYSMTDWELTDLSRHAQFALASAIQAIEDARLDVTRLDRDRVGVFVGTTNSAPDKFERVWEEVTHNGAETMIGKPLPAEFSYALLANSAAIGIAIHYGFHGLSCTVSDACSSGMNAVDQAQLAIRDGFCDIALAGGADASITPMGLDCYCVLGAVSRRNDAPEQASRPFDHDRDGFVLGEGAAMLVLEEYAHARQRGATIYAEIVGVANKTSAFHMTALPTDGGPLSRVMLEALHRGGLGPQDVDYINAHGTSTPLNDRSESAAIRAAFGERAYKIPVTSTKCVIGHTQGAASAHQLVVLCMSLRDQVLHPTINYEFPDPDCDLDYVPNVAREARLNVVMANACGFGGFNSSIVLRRLA